MSPEPSFPSQQLDPVATATDDREPARPVAAFRLDAASTARAGGEGTVTRAERGAV